MKECLQKVKIFITESRLLFFNLMHTNLKCGCVGGLLLKLCEYEWCSSYPPHVWVFPFPDAKTPFFIVMGQKVFLTKTLFRFMELTSELSSLIDFNKRLLRISLFLRIIPLSVWNWVNSFFKFRKQSTRSHRSIKHTFPHMVLRCFLLEVWQQRLFFVKVCFWNHLSALKINSISIVTFVHTFDMYRIEQIWHIREYEERTGKCLSTFFFMNGSVKYKGWG